ncbi:gluconokinase [Ensifer sp. ENS07]|uniref:gluconokinase n=1 Tax=Ensifer sp. ENS07 TaxID=2769274 RepID=UPI001783FF86|nr:gluconokinase [Ensifer sp. ENS07]MBD9638928.1 gluconokinase [Ensifer sp. ENS07]
MGGQPASFTQSGQYPRFIVVMGVAGTGKSEIGRRLAGLLGCNFIEADELHSRENVERMRNGYPLTDELRMPWLNSVCDRASVIDASPVVVACSVLKRSYRELLRQRLPGVRFLFLHGSPELISARLGARTGHFATGSLLESQLATLEAPDGDEEAIWLEITLSPNLIAERAAVELLGSVHST